MTKLEKQMKEKGWYICSTGGGCEAYTMSCPSGGAMMITDDGGLEAPISKTQKIMVGVYDDGGQQLATFYLRTLSMLFNNAVNILEM